MRLLFLSNFCPPCGHGGYEQWCQEVADGLSTRSHEVAVLTSRHGGTGDSGDRNPRVIRQLHLEMELVACRNALLFFFDRRRRECVNLRCMRNWVDEFEPDAIVVWGMWNLPRSLPALAEDLRPEHTVYYFGDYWPILRSQWWDYWQASARNALLDPPKRWLRSCATRLLTREEVPILRFPHALFPSEFLYHAYEEAGVVVGSAKVISGGVDTRAYRCIAAQPPLSASDAPLRLLVAGRLVPDKGIHTAIEALAILVSEHGLRNVCLTIAGTGASTYVASLGGLAADLGVGKEVHIIGSVPKVEMPRLYSQNHILIFPSVWPEPFGRVLVEAMAAGLPVVGTTVGGAGEILREGETGLAFRPEDAHGLAAQVVRLVNDDKLRLRLTRQGQESVMARFDMERMTGGIEQYLQQVVNS